MNIWEKIITTLLLVFIFFFIVTYFILYRIQDFQVNRYSEEQEQVSTNEILLKDCIKSIDRVDRRLLNSWFKLK